MLDVIIDNHMIRVGDRFALGLHRTLRIPDDGRIYPLPPGLGRFQLFKVLSYRDRVPSQWIEEGGALIPMYQREALWLGFHAADWKPSAVKIAVGGINVISGEPLHNALNADPQDYIVCPDQPWLDGINTGHGSIRQFVAMLLGEGYTVEAALTGKETLGGTPQQQVLAQEQAGWWSEHANLTFNFNNATDAEIRITFNPSDGAWSYVGTDCLNIPKNQATMNLGFQNGGRSGHEFGHAIGLGHEHQNPAGGIEWNEDVVIRDLAGSPNFWTPEQTRHNVIRKYSLDQINGTEFDPDSIMLYAFPGSWTQSGQSTHANEALSNLDRAFIASALAYPADEMTEPVDLPVIDTAGTAASIGQPGEEDMFKFTATTSDRYTIETGGQTDVVMKLFGPGSKTEMIAEDDDGGAGRNSKILADLSPGEYFVQIRHYNTTGGTGDYTIKVSK